MTDLTEASLEAACLKAQSFRDDTSVMAATARALMLPAGGRPNYMSTSNHIPPQEELSDMTNRYLCLCTKCQTEILFYKIRPAYKEFAKKWRLITKNGRHRRYNR